MWISPLAFCLVRKKSIEFGYLVDGSAGAGVG